MHADRLNRGILAPGILVAQARTYLGVPWRHQGRTRAGLDCVGLIVRVAHDLGLSDYDTAGYGRRAQGQGFVEHFRNHMDAIALGAAREGDVLVFAEQTYPCHCAILAERFDNAHILHAHALRRAVVEEPYAGEWPERVKFAFRFRGIEG